MPRFLLLLPCLLLLLPLRGQQDSLQALLRGAQSDTARIRLLLALHEAAGSDTAAARSWLDQALALSGPAPAGPWPCRAWLRLARARRLQGALAPAAQALASVQARCLNHDPAVSAAYYLEHGILHQYAGRYDSAVQDFLVSLRSYEAAGLPERVAIVYNNIANIYWELDRSGEALAYYQRALAIYDSTGNERESSDVLGNIGLIFRAQQDYAQAEAYYLRALGIDRKYGNLASAAVNHQNLGALYTRTGAYPQALESFRAAAALSRQTGDAIGLLYADHGAASVRLQQGQYPAAIAGFTAALASARALGYREEVKNLYESLSEAHERAGSYREALGWRKQFEALKDSLAGEQFAGRIQELEVQYETERKDRQIALLAREKALEAAESRRQATLKWASVAGLCLVAGLAGLIFYVLRQRLRSQALLAAKQQEIQAAEFRSRASRLELKALRAQINPHFLFNCMNSISRLILAGENDRAARYLGRFSALLRQMLEHSEAQTVPLEEELALLRAYIELEALRFKSPIEYRIELEPGLEPDRVSLPPMVLQPFVENAIWHGLMHKAPGEPGRIRIAVAEQGDLLACTVEDNGVGRARARELQQDMVLKPRSMGLSITEERLSLLGPAGRVRVTDLHDGAGLALGTRVDISIPLA